MSAKLCIIIFVGLVCLISAAPTEQNRQKRQTIFFEDELDESGNPNQGTGRASDSGFGFPRDTRAPRWDHFGPMWGPAVSHDNNFGEWTGSQSGHGARKPGNGARKPGYGAHKPGHGAHKDGHEAHEFGIGPNFGDDDFVPSPDFHGGSRFNALPKSQKISDFAAKGPVHEKLVREKRQLSGPGNNQRNVAGSWNQNQPSWNEIGNNGNANNGPDWDNIGLGQNNNGGAWNGNQRPNGNGGAWNNGNDQNWNGNQRPNNAWNGNQNNGGWNGNQRPNGNGGAWNGNQNNGGWNGNQNNGGWNGNQNNGAWNGNQRPNGNGGAWNGNQNNGAWGGNQRPNGNQNTNGNGNQNSWNNGGAWNGNNQTPNGGTDGGSWGGNNNGGPTNAAGNSGNLGNSIDSSSNNRPRPGGSNSRPRPGSSQIRPPIAIGGARPPSTPAPNCNCPATSETNPVCGTDGSTYSNPSKLQCARVCNTSPGVQMQHYGACPATTQSPDLRRRG